MTRNIPIKVLITDDNKALREVLVRELMQEGFAVSQAEDGSLALTYLEKYDCDVLILDLHLPTVNGIDVLRQVKALEIPVEIIILTGYGSITSAVEAMKLGAYDYLTKPFKIPELQAAIIKAHEKKMLLRENLSLKTQLQRQKESQKIISKNPRMLQILEDIRKLASSNLPILITGESGVGKELVAQAVHELSERATGPFIPINCSAIPEQMMESELFGYERGAFTGAVSRKLGMMELADQGTLFLDEIGELSSGLQAKLLRVIETGRFFKVGGVKEMQVDVKFVSATNRDLKQEMENGSSRRDLYYRISAIQLDIPPLRKRPEDIPLLIGHFKSQTRAHHEKSFSPEALAILSNYTWPGNVRELKNVINRTLLLAPDDVITPAHLPADLHAHPPQTTDGQSLEDMEREYILRVLAQTDGNKGETAKILGIDPKTLYRKLKKYGV